MRTSFDIGVGALLAAGLLLVFREPLASMAVQWNASPMYSYGYMVPPISAFLLWSQRDELARQGATPNRFWGGAVILLSLAMLAVGQVGAIQIFQQLAFVVAIAGMVLFLFGRAHLMLSAPAIGYLLFMVPMWDAFTEPLHWPFQNNSAKLGVAIMQAIGVPVHREGTLIALPNLLIEVARECSGVNYLVAVLALGLPLSLLRLRQPWRRVLLVGSALIVAALANGLRVALIGTLAYYDIGSPLHGPFHVLHGLFVAGIGYVVILVGLQVLQKGDGPPRVRREAVPTLRERSTASRWRVGEAFGLATIFWTLAFIGVAPQAHEVALARPLEALPLQLGGWTADSTSTQLDDKPKESPLAAVWGRADRRLDRRYRSADGQTVTVEVFYFASQQQDREIISSTSAEVYRQASRIVIAAGDGRQFEANALEWPDRTETGLFWYDVDGRTAAGQVTTKVITLWRALWLGRTNGAAVVLRTATDSRALATLQDFAKVLQPALAGLWASSAVDAPARLP